MDINENSTVGEITASNYHFATVFSKYAIDFCCNGNRSIKAVCEEINLNPSELIQDLNTIVSDSSGAQHTPDYNAWSLDMLTNYIEKKHHQYIIEHTPLLQQHLIKINTVHGANHPEITAIQKLFISISDELTIHMKKEELMLFPYIGRMVSAKEEGTTLVQPLFGKVEYPIQVMMAEHDQEGEKFRKIASLSNGFQAPADACNTYRATYAMLKEFEEDLHLHIHLENNILFPKAAALELDVLKN